MKFPVRRAIGATFAFVLHNAADVLRIVWAPFAIVIIAMVLIGPGYARDIAELTQIDPEDAEAAMSLLGSLMPKVLLLLAIMAVTYSMIFGGLLRFVIRGEKPRTPFYLTFAADELRLLGTWLLLGLLFIGVELGLFIVGGLAAFLASAAGGVGAVISGALGLAVFAFLIWLVLRLSVTSPGAVSDRRIGIGPSWRVTKGHALGLLAYWLFWILIAVVIQLIVIAVTIPDYFSLMATAASPESGEEAVREAEARLNQLGIEAFNLSNPAAIARFALTTVIGAIGASFAAITGGVAWRYLEQDAGTPELSQTGTS